VIVALCAALGVGFLLLVGTPWGDGFTPSSPAIVFLGLGFFGVLAILSLIAILRPDRLEISASGVSVRHLWSVQTLRWDQVGSFRPVLSLHPGNSGEMVGVSAGPPRQHFAFRLVGPKWEIPASEVLALLEQGRARWADADGTSDPSSPLLMGDRLSRRGYWIGIAILLAVGTAASLFPRGEEVAGGLAGGLIGMSRGRFHDLGLSAWWSLGLAPAIVALLMISRNLPYLEYSLVHGLSLVAWALLSGLALASAALIWLGAKPGDPIDNPYGVPPGARPQLVF
jgi:uncharacterized membrane protein YhaH (DUF805 family)